MRSQLTRSVFRRLLSNRGFIFCCPHQIAHRPRQRHVYPLVLRGQQRRTFFGFLSKPQDEPRGPDLDPGLREMMDLSKALHLKHRQAPTEDLIAAFRSFITHKISQKEALTDIEAEQALKTFRHLQGTDKEGEDLTLDMKLLSDTMSALRILPNGNSEFHRTLAKELFQETQKRIGDGVYEKSVSLKFYLKVLSQTGDTAEVKAQILKHREASELLKDHEDLARSRETLEGKFWIYAFSGFTRENNETEMLDAMKQLQDVGKDDTSIAVTLIQFYAARNDVTATKKWFDYHKNTNPNRLPSAMVMREIITFSTRNDEQEWCKEVFRDALERPQSLKNSHWDVMFYWAAGALGKGVEEVERMMAVMEGQPCHLHPNIITINSLVSLAMSQGDPYLAERYIALGLKKGIQPDAETFLLQMDYRISAGDLSGAHDAYTSLQSEEILGDEDLPAVNGYLCALCVSSKASYDIILSIVTDLSDRNVRMEADTVIALSKLYLQHNQMEDVKALLDAHTYHYNYAERSRSFPPFLEFIFDHSNTDQQVWDAYNVLRTSFDELDVVTRTKCMNEFFRRGRPDMGTHTFGHMRAHDYPELRPKRETYVACFEGIADCQDEESLEVVHNMLKLDSNIEPCTLLYNALMLVYNSIGRSNRALQFWDDITNSEEGPSYRSLEIFFWCCGKQQFGELRARQTWDRMRRMDIEITPQVFAQYVGALAGNNKLGDVADSVRGLDQKLEGIGFDVDAHILGTAYNMISNSGRQAEFKGWAQNFFPDVWKEVEKLPIKQHVKVTTHVDMLNEYVLRDRLRA